MKGKEYKKCVYCDKKKAHGPYPFMKPYAVCSSCVDNIPSFSSDVDRWRETRTPLDQILREAHETYQQSQEG
jgi:hypothetical protein